MITNCAHTNKKQLFKKNVLESNNFADDDANVINR